MAFYAAGSTKARMLDRCADRLHFGNKKTFLLHARAPHPGSSVRWWISLSTRLDISTLKSFEARHIIYLTKLAVSIRYDSTGTLSNITETFYYFISLCVALFFLSCMTYIWRLHGIFFTGCSCVVYSSSDRPQGGTFISPDFPKRYPPNIDCLLYTFIGHADEIVVLTFHQFNIRRTWPE